MNEIKQKNLETKIANYKPTSRKYTLRERVLKFLSEHPNDWFYVWEAQGQTCEYGFLSHKTDNEFSYLANKGLIEKHEIGKYTAYSHKDN